LCQITLTFAACVKREVLLAHSGPFSIKFFAFAHTFLGIENLLVLTVFSSQLTRRRFIFTGARFKVHHLWRLANKATFLVKGLAIALASWPGQPCFFVRARDDFFALSANNTGTRGLVERGIVGTGSLLVGERAITSARVCIQLVVPPEAKSLRTRRLLNIAIFIEL
jgi:hypothetical protein